MSIADAPSQNSQLETLQILRAVASTSVVYYHIGSVPCFGGVGSLLCFGGFGVDIFFVLSGFVMAMIAATGQTKSRFAVNRISRIVPLYWVLTTFLLALAVVMPELLNSTTANLSNYLRSIFFIPYFKENGTLMPLLFVGWSLNYEMFFYVCVGLSLIIARKYSLWLTVGLLLAVYIGFGHYADNQVFNRFFGNEIMLEFALGMFAFLAYDKRYLARISLGVMVAVGLAGYFFMAAVEANALHFSRILSYGVPSFLVVCSAVGLERVVNSAPRAAVKVLVGVGDASYATYLSHAYVTEAVRKILSQKFSLINLNSLVGVVLTLCLALTVGAVIYKLIDKPLSQCCKARMERLLVLLKNWRLVFRHGAKVRARARLPS